MNSLPEFVARYWTIAGWTMLHFLWLGGLAWLMTIVTRRILERFSPQTRYAWSLIWLVGLTGLAVGLLVRMETHGGLIEAAPANAEFAPPLPTAVTQSVSPYGLAPATRTLAAFGSLDAATPTNRWGKAIGPAIERGAALLPWVWCLGTPLVSLMFLTGIVGTFRLRLRSRPVADCAVVDALARLQATLHVGQRVLLAVTEQVTSPLVVGIVRPLILLPPSVLSGLSPDQLEMILLHELAHIRRWDNLVNLLQRVIEAVLFFQPAVWWTSRWVRLEREHCCDALVLAHGRDPQAYAETLASLALPELAPRYAAAAMANHQLVSRIRHILNVEHQPMGRSFRNFAWSGVVLAIVGIGCLIGLDPGRGKSALAQGPGAGVADVVTESNTDDLRVEAEDINGGIGANQGWGATYVDLDQDGWLDLYVANAADGNPARPWSPQQATGAPDVTEAGDDGHAWGSLTKDGQEEWLLLTYEKAVRTSAVIVHESFNPGAVYKLGLIDSHGNEVTVWEGLDPIRPHYDKGVAVLPVKHHVRTAKVKLYLNSPAVAGRNEIDAVGLLDLATGDVQWAISAQASSSYADHGIERAGGVREKLTLEQCAVCHVVGDELSAHIQEGWIHGRAPVCPKWLKSQLLNYPQAPWRTSGGAGGESLLDRRKRADQLRRELKALDLEIARQETEAAAAEQERKALDESAARKAFDAALQQSYATDPAAHSGQPGEAALSVFAEPRDPQQTLQELAETLKRQQSAIEKLTQALEALQTKIGNSSPGSDARGKESATEGESPDSNGAAAVNPAGDPNRLRVTDLLNAMPSDVDDATFLRRIMLDLTGLPPKPEWVKRFVDDTTPDKRQQVVREILELAPPGVRNEVQPPRDPAASP